MVEVASGLIATRRAERQYNFDRQVAAAIEALQVQLQGHPRVNEALQSDEFMAAYERASRTASESASNDHRMRLAWAAAQMGPWSGTSRALRQQLFAMVNDMEDAHVRVLTFLDDPRAYIQPLDTDGSLDRLLMDNLRELIIKWVFNREVGSQTLAEIIIRFLESNQLAKVPNGSMTAQGALSCHTTELGRELLHFIQFPQS